VLHTGQRPKADDYPGADGRPSRLFVVSRMIMLMPDDTLSCEQVSFFLGRNTLLTFQETRGDVFNPIRQRLKVKDSRLRTSDVSFLLYSLLDAIIDRLFPILEYYSEQLEDIEEVVLTRPTLQTLQEIHRVKRELILLRRSVWPLRELMNTLQREGHECLSAVTRTYLRDVYDHVIQIIDFIETYREFSTGLSETYLSTSSNRLNEVMKTLTIISTIFVPLTFFAGVYGMNMPIPENDWWGTYPLFWVFSLGLAGAMLLYFRRRGWF
jgi:magnesium transporter